MRIYLNRHLSRFSFILGFKGLTTRLISDRLKQIVSVNHFLLFRVKVQQERRVGFTPFLDLFHKKKPYNDVSQSNTKPVWLDFIPNVISFFTGEVGGYLQWSLVLSHLITATGTTREKALRKETHYIVYSKNNYNN